jgi:DNA adenine methylase
MGDGKMAKRVVDRKQPIQPLQFYGGKFYLVKHILPLIPPHRIYCEPFAGGAAVFWAKEPSPIEVLNDIDFRIVAFYRCLRDDRLWRKLQRMCDLTPYSRAENYSALRHIKECVANPKAIDTLDDNELVTLAWRFFVANRTVFNGKLRGDGWSYAKTPDAHSVRRFRNKITLFAYFHERLKRTYIECDDAVRVIRLVDTPETFFFVDPPYLPAVIKAPQNYDFWMTESDHRRLLETLCHVQGKVLITHPRCSLYESYLKGWVVKEVTYYKYSTALSLRIPQTFYDALWLNYEPKVSKDGEDEGVD